MLQFKTWFACALIIILIFTMAGCNTTQQKNDEEVSAANEETKSLLVYSGAGLRKPMDEIGKIFQEKYNVEVQYTYGGSAQLLSQIELSGKGDVFIPGSAFYYEEADQKGLVDERHHVAYHIPVIVVSKDNPKDIKRIEDLGKEDVKLVLGDEKACAIGKVSKKMLEKNELYDQVTKNRVASTATVNELLIYITMKQADATIMWEDNVEGVEDVEIVAIPEEKNDIKTIPIATVKNSSNKDLAQNFVDFVVSHEGKNIFQKYGFKTID
ncbi:molybdate ABC transporter substrate-binding protein [Clostridiaceae bacterium 35-E11]